MKSVYNQHNCKIRNIGEQNANDELFVAYNGPEIGEVEEALRDALDLDGILLQTHSFILRDQL